MEIWRDIKGWEGLYKISNLVRVKSLDRVVHNQNGSYNKPGRILKQNAEKDGSGYKRVQLMRDSKKRGYLVHRLVYETFNGPIPENLVIDHDDNNKTNNLPNNLQAITNRLNSSKDRKSKNKYPGVYKDGKKWKARIGHNWKEIYLGRFDVEEDARDAYLNKLKEIESGTDKVCKDSQERNSSKKES